MNMGRQSRMGMQKHLPITILQFLRYVYDHINNIIQPLIFKAVNDGFRNYQWQNDLVEHLYKDIERRVRDPLGKLSGASV